MDARTQSLALVEPIVTGNTKAAAAAAGATSADLWMVPYEQLHYDPRDNVRPVDQQWVSHLTALIIANGCSSKHLRRFTSSSATAPSPARS